MIIDGIASAETLDTSGEILEIKGHDISDLEEGRGVLNFEHRSESPEDIIGKIIFAKKIMKKDDCEGDREKMYWDSCKTPFVYIKSELFDEEKHPGAIAAAAIIRYYNNRKEKILAGFSIEGSTLERDDNILKRTVARRVALTLRPCNRAAISGVLEDPNTPDKVKKYMNIDTPINTKLYEVDTCILEDINKTEGDPLVDLQKTLTAGGYDVAPSQLSGGAALSVEHGSKMDKRTLNNVLRAAVRDWDRTRPLKDAIKAALPEVSNSYINHFTQLAEEMSLKKGLPSLVRIDPHHSYNNIANDEQKQLLTGLYLDPKSEYHGEGFGGMNFPNHKMFKLKNDAGDQVLVKPPFEDNQPHDHAMAATDYYHLAKNYFGLGDHVPVTNHFDHALLQQNSPKSAQAMQYLNGAKTAFSPEFDKVLNSHREDGTLHKLALMDMVTGGGRDRHFGNVVVHDGKIKHIDNDDAFDYSPSKTKVPIKPHYYADYDIGGGTKQGMGNDTIHIDANRWLQGLDPKKLALHMRAQGQEKPKVVEAVRRLQTLKGMANSAKTFNEMYDHIHGPAVI